MSDGPYRSLPMSPRWKRVAESLENQAFDISDVCSRALAAVADDWNRGIQGAVLDQVKNILTELTLFPDAAERTIRLQHLAAGGGLGRVLADQATEAIQQGLTGENALEEAAKQTVKSALARAMRDVEEHYCRRASGPMTRTVRARLDQALCSVDVSEAARGLCGLDRREHKPHADIHSGLDDGVVL